MNGNVAWRDKNRSSCSVSQFGATRISIAIFQKKCKRGWAQTGASEAANDTRKKRAPWGEQPLEQNFGAWQKRGLISALLRTTTSGLRRNARAEHEFGEKA